MCCLAATISPIPSERESRAGSGDIRSHSILIRVRGIKIHRPPSWRFLFESDVVGSGDTVRPSVPDSAENRRGDPLLSLPYLVIRWIFGTVAWIARSSRDQALEIVVLRHQLEVLKRQLSRPQFQPRDRVLLAAASRFLPEARRSSFIVRPETLLRWHLHLVTRQAARWGSRRRGRPPIPPGVTELIVRLANDNLRWATSASVASSSSSATTCRR